ncbi:MAG: hypothetical protein J2P17_25605 [Mycobacterium sp.]|nr:hypothetical protein [Mycobacterium sp.]
MSATEGAAGDLAVPPVNVIHLPVELKVRGLGPSRLPSSGEEIDAMTNTSKLLAITHGVHQLGDHDITEVDMPLNQHLGGRPAAAVADADGGLRMLSPGRRSATS